MSRALDELSTQLAIAHAEKHEVVNLLQTTTPLSLISFLFAQLAARSDADKGLFLEEIAALRATSQVGP